MRDFTTLEIIKIVPMSKELREELISHWETYEEERKYLISRACWQSFHEFRDKVTQFVYNEFLTEVEGGRRKMTDTFMEDVDKEVESVFNEMLAGKQNEREEISQIRSRLQNLISDKIH